MALRNRPSPQQRAHCRLHERPPVGLTVLTMPSLTNRAYLIYAAPATADSCIASSFPTAKP
jgi:hypothetical protein